MKNFILATITLLFLACGPSSDDLIHQAIQHKKAGQYIEAEESLHLAIEVAGKEDSENVTRANELLHEIAEEKAIAAEKNGWNRVLKNPDVISTVQQYITNFPNGRNIDKAKRKLQTLEKKAEEDLWDQASVSDDLTLVERYIYKYPTGINIEKAQQLKTKLQAKIIDDEYKLAKTKNSSKALIDFLEKYPDYKHVRKIKKEIIRLEVSEILADERTATLPPPQSLGGSSSSTKVSIKNDTKYQLVVRYSGPSTRRVELSPNGETTISLRSGKYSVAATANGLHYGGTQQLAGSYSSSYYIVSY